MTIILEGGDQTRGQGEDQGMGQGKSWKRGGEGIDDGETYDGPHLGGDGEKGYICDNF